MFDLVVDNAGEMDSWIGQLVKCGEQSAWCGTTPAAAYAVYEFYGD